jgi:hypothetical protein
MQLFRLCPQHPQPRENNTNSCDCCGFPVTFVSRQLKKRTFVRSAAHQFTGFFWGPGGSEPPTPPSSSLSVLTKRTCLMTRADLAGSRVEAFRRGDSTNVRDALWLQTWLFGLIYLGSVINGVKDGLVDFRAKIRLDLQI